MNRRVGLWGVLLIVVATVVALVALTPVLQGDGDAEPERSAATPAVTRCTPAADPFGSPPDGFEYAKVTERTRAETVRALKLDEAGGRVDMRAARQGKLTLGTLVGVPSKDPAAYVDELVSTADRGGSPVARRPRFTLIPLESGTVVAAGAKGCTAILISALDPSAVRFLATTVFSG